MKTVLGMLIPLALAGAAAAAEPGITFDSKQVIATGITPGGRAVCYGVAHDWVDLHRAIYRWGREGIDADLDGEVAIELPREVPARSVWACADVTTGRIAILTPEGTPGVEIPLRGRGALLGASGNDRFEIESARVDLVLLVPGEGAWLQLTGDGSDIDDDRRIDGVVNARASEFKGIGALRSAAASLRGTFTLVAFDPLTLEYAVVRGGKR